MSLSPTVAACLTPAGAAAIAVIGIRGANAWPIVAALLEGSVSARPPGPGSHRLVRVADSGQSDPVVLTRPNEDCVEVHCHGGVGVVRWIMGLLRKQGVEEIGWQEWLRRADSTPFRTEAALALPRAPTVRTAGILLDQFHGACDRAVHRILAALEEKCLEDAKRLLQALVARIPLGMHLITPWRVVLAGAPNVGKSTLLNALVGFDRVISSPIPGTTRDVVRSTTAFDGWPVELVDTAGLHEAAAGLEAAGVQRARRELGEADLVLWVLDAGQAPVLPPSVTNAHLVFVINKIDLPPVWNAADSPDLTDACRVSAKTREGIDALAKRIVDELIPIFPEPGAAVPIGEGVCRQLEAAAAHLRRGDPAACQDALGVLAGGSG